MRTIDRVRTSAARPANRLRLVSMLAMLALLFMLIQRAADPSTWAWLATDDEAAQQPTTSLIPVAAAAPAETIIPGPTDTDPLERDSANELFQALTDRSTQLSREEMPAYWRLFSWVQHQSFAELNSRSTPAAVLDQFVQRPDEQRGKLFRLDLNVRRVLPYDAPENSAGIEKVYEIWGFTTESQAWLYVVLTSELPPGMPIGPNVHERATFAGYFLKNQGYHAAGAKPTDKVLPAPLLIGRIEHHPEPAAQPAQGFASTSWLTWATIIAGGIIVIGWFVLQSRSRPQRGVSISSQAESTRKAKLEGWLADAHSSAPNHNEQAGNSAH